MKVLHFLTTSLPWAHSGYAVRTQQELGALAAAAGAAAPDSGAMRGAGAADWAVPTWSQNARRLAEMYRTLAE